MGRVKTKLRAWKDNLLSQAGKEVLIKPMVTAILAYSTACFLLPKSLSKKINSMAAKFLWGQKGEERKIHWRPWEQLGMAKYRGGLGFQDLLKFNQALLAKQGLSLV